MKKSLALIAVVALTGCYRGPSQAMRDTSWQNDACFTLTNRLAQRDTMPIDLSSLGKALVGSYGEKAAWGSVRQAFRELSHGASETNCCNVIWIQDQPPRVRDLSWLICFKGEWLPQ